MNAIRMQILQSLVKCFQNFELMCVRKKLHTRGLWFSLLPSKVGGENRKH